MEIKNNNINSEILDEDFHEIPAVKYLIGNYTLDELLKIFGVLFLNIVIIIGCQLMFERLFLARLIIPFSGILIFTFLDWVAKSKHLRWKVWVLFFTFFYYILFEFIIEIL